MAKQEANCDILLKGGTVLNVYSGELLAAEVSIRDGKIWSVGRSVNGGDDASVILDVTDKVLVPGYIEPHAHGNNIYTPVSFGEEACKRGITTFFCDNLVYFPLMGVEVFEEFMEELSHGPVKVFWFCRTNPQTPMKDEEEVFSFESIERLLKSPHVKSIGEITRWPDLLRGDPKIVKSVEAAKTANKRVDGHLAGVKAEKLNILCRSGVESCHESITGEEVLDRLRLGLHVMLRCSSLRRDLADLLQPIVEKGILTERLMLTTDASTAAYHQDHGMTDSLIEIAIREGIPPVLAYRMATLNPAVYYGLDRQIGGIAPGRDADILILSDLSHPTPETTISKGRIVAENGKTLERFPGINWERFFPETSFIHRPWSAANHFFQIPCKDKSIGFPVIQLVSAVITRVKWASFDSGNGFLTLGREGGFIFCALLDRNGRWVTNGILEGFGDGVEGLASSYNTANEILVLGRQPDAMKHAANRVLELKGGIVIVEDGKIIYEFPLPITGYCSELSMQAVASKEREFTEILRKRGYPFHAPLYTLAFLPNDFLPEVRINYNGVVDIKKNKKLWARRDLQT